MNERALRVLILTLEELHFDSVRQIWQEHKCLHKYFVGISMEINDWCMEYHRLTLFSEDFCEAVFIPASHFAHWSDCLELAMSLMRRNLIDYAIYVVNQLHINDVHRLANIVMRNGSLAALNAMPQREAVLKTICRKNRAIYISNVSDELYKLADRWNVLFDGNPNRVGLIVFVVEEAIRYRSPAMVKWINDNLDSYANLDRTGFRRRLRNYHDRLEKAFLLATTWKHAPAIDLVQFLLNAQQ